MAALVVTKSERTCPKRPSKNPFDKLGHNKNIHHIYEILQEEENLYSQNLYFTQRFDKIPSWESNIEQQDRA